MLMAGCHIGGLPPKPAIEITRVPLASPGGPEQLDILEGPVVGAEPGEQVVLYAKSGVWWIQPYATQTSTNIQPDSTRKNSTHLGTEYAALLVLPGYRPQFKMTTLPNVGNGVVATAIARGKEGAPIVSKVIHFSGLPWTVRTAGSDRGGQPNTFDPANVWTDSKGHLL